MQNKAVDTIEQWIFYSLGGFAFFSNLSIAIGNVFLGLSLLLLILRLIKKHDDLSSHLRLDKGLQITLIFLVGVIALSALFSAEALTSLGGFSDYYLYRMMPFFIVLLIVRNRSKILFLLKLVAISFLINMGYVLWQGWQGIPRASGFIFCMATAAFLSIGVPSGVLLFLELTKRKEKYITMICIMLSFGAALYNATRGAWIAIALTSICVLILAVKNKRKVLISFLVAAGVLTVLFMSNPVLEHRFTTLGQMDYQSNRERILLWRSAYHMFEDHPLLGVGFGQFKKAYQTQYILPEAKEPWLGHAHNNFMQLLAESGILGGIAVLSMWVYFIYFSIRGWRQERKWEYLFFFIVVISTMIQGLTEYNMGNSMVMKLYWFLLGISLQLINIDKGMVMGK